MKDNNVLDYKMINMQHQRKNTQKTHLYNIGKATNGAKKRRILSNTLLVKTNLLLHYSLASSIEADSSAGAVACATGSSDFSAVFFELLRVVLALEAFFSTLRRFSL